MITEIPNDVQHSIERYLSTYGVENVNVELMADAFTGYGKGAYDGKQYTPYPEGTKERVIAYISSRINK